MACGQPNPMRSQGHSEGVQRLRNLVPNPKGRECAVAVERGIPRPFGLRDDTQRLALSKLDTESRDVAMQRFLVCRDAHLLLRRHLAEQYTAAVRIGQNTALAVSHSCPISESTNHRIPAFSADSGKCSCRKRLAQAAINNDSNGPCHFRWSGGS